MKFSVDSWHIPVGLAAMLRAVKVSLSQMTATKGRRLGALLARLQALTQRYIDYLWTSPGGLDKETMDRCLENQLSYRHRSNCLKNALEVVSQTRRLGRAVGRVPGKPTAPYRMSLSSLVCKVEKGKGSFDYVLKVSGLVPFEKIIIPFKSHKVLNYWLSKPLAELRQGAIINLEEAILWIKLPDLEPKSPGPVLAVDAGVCKLLVDSEGKQYGTDCREVLSRVRRCKPGSAGKRRAITARKEYFNRLVKSLPWDRISAIAHEDLKGIKTGKKKNRGKSFRKLIAPWTVRQVFTRIAQLGVQNRVRVLSVDPRDTSRTCPVDACRHVASENRKAEVFKCVRCGHRQDADAVGALNILDKALKTLGSLWCPSNQEGLTA